MVHNLSQLGAAQVLAAMDARRPRPLASPVARVWAVLLDALAEIVERCDVDGEFTQDGFAVAYSHDYPKGLLLLTLGYPEDFGTMFLSEVGELNYIDPSVGFEAKDDGDEPLLEVRVKRGSVPCLASEESRAKAARMLDGEAR